ncbi:outer dense fiber protein 2 isoform X3 [Salmo salar]|uniref:Outer dense fiber protein 2 n=1 Tax=Salmo salar TaxID=8030 RepID=A0A1S3KXH9_SALSA|nr:outer dense fiber protein 2-like isoform X3 [Salmo salar]|eukprot:XP_013983348.1 PREDICTED: outer dense fiber protein 2-like isoform X4 [Salmo salar]
MKKAMRTRSISPPLHVHVNETTPVHVHVKKSRSPSRTPQGKTKGDGGNLRPTAKVKTRVPWIPPGKASMRDASYKWEGPSHRLEITPLPEPETSNSPLRLADLSSEEEEVLHGRINQYERKIDSLMTEVELRRKEQLLERQSEKLSASQRVIEEQEEELAEVSKELEVTERENSRLRHSMEKMLEETDCTSRVERSMESMQLEKDTLLRKLMEAEMDGMAAARQVSALRETVTKMRSSSASRMSGSESSFLARQKELLLQKLETFESTNLTLRHLLREQHGREMESMRISEQKDVLLKRLTNTEAENSHLVLKLQEKEREVNQLTTLMDTEKENAKTTGELSKVLESTRAHLQSQLRSKEADNNRLAVQIKNLERAANQQQGEMDHLLEQLRGLKLQAESDKEALKRATRAQKHRAERSEDTAGQLRAQLLDMENQMVEALSAAENWRGRHAQEMKDKTQLDMEVSVLNSRVSDLTEQLHGTEDKARAEREGLLDRLHSLTTEGTHAKLENQSLKAMLSAVEEKLTLSQSEVQHVKASVKQYESLVDSYKTQVVKTRAEADEYCARLGQAEREVREVREQLESEVEVVRRELLGRLTELEPLPEALRRSEVLLEEAQDREHAQERRSTELSTVLADLRMKVEQQGSQVELLRQKKSALLEENKQLQHRVENLERKLEEATCQNRDLVGVIAKREETIHGNQLRLEEKSHECTHLTRQLEEALDDARRQVSQTRERAITKERSTQSKVVDLETQLSRTTTELTTLRRSKEEAERRYQSRLQDVKDRLEQSDSTNRSLQNYVQFLKASYANVFGDSALTSTLRAPSPI